MPETIAIIGTIIALIAVIIALKKTSCYLTVNVETIWMWLFSWLGHSSMILIL
jgi:hypothetical protein